MPDWDFDEDGSQDSTGDGESKSFKDLRNHAKKLEREQKAAMQELEELRAFRTQVIEEKREAALSTTFKEVGLPETHAKLFKALNPELEVEKITPESVFEFAKEYGLVAAETPAPEKQEAKPTGFTPVAIGQPPSLKTYTTEEINALLRAGSYDEVNRAVKEGRVEKEATPWSR